MYWDVLGSGSRLRRWASLRSVNIFFIYLKGGMKISLGCNLQPKFSLENKCVFTCPACPHFVSLTRVNLISCSLLCWWNWWNRHSNGLSVSSATGMVERVSFWTKKQLKQVQKPKHCDKGKQRLMWAVVLLNAACFSQLLMIHPLCAQSRGGNQSTWPHYGKTTFQPKSCTVCHLWENIIK